ncbi:SAF domain-containing protein [Candidatus Poriferisodalis sp.]|uniref:SAF domain-containing protein n=1 Tax=Candidatus Poriferisodalis sp. TaxID=3101277 RepID=UPI003B02945C
MCGAAALGLWWAFEQSAAAPETSYVVARTRLAPGRVIEPADVALVSIRLPAEIEATVFGEGDGNDVVGSVVLEAIHAGELLARGDVGSRRSTAGRDAGYAVAVELDRPGALNGLIAAGDRVDAVVTDRSLAVTTGSQAPGLVAAGAIVLDVDDLAGTGQLSDTITVTLQVRDRAAAVALAAGADAGAITLIRPWGASAQAAP